MVVIPELDWIWQAGTFIWIVGFLEWEMCLCILNFIFSETIDKTFIYGIAQKLPSQVIISETLFGCIVNTFKTPNLSENNLCDSLALK